MSSKNDPRDLASQRIQNAVDSMDRSEVPAGTDIFAKTEPDEQPPVSDEPEPKQAPTKQARKKDLAISHQTPKEFTNNRVKTNQTIGNKSCHYKILILLQQYRYSLFGFSGKISLQWVQLHPLDLFFLGCSQSFAELILFHS